eukprot:4255801-Pleurochrysis_carterae.AAC.4
MRGERRGRKGKWDGRRDDLGSFGICWWARFVGSASCLVLRFCGRRKVGQKQAARKVALSKAVAQLLTESGEKRLAGER